MLFRDYIKNTFVPTKKAVHDCVDTGADLVITGGAQRIPLPIDGLGRNKFNEKAFFDTATSKIQDSIVWALLMCEFNFKFNGPINTTITVEIEIDHPTIGIIPIASREFVLPKNNIDFNVPTWQKQLYNSDDSEAHLYGFDCYIKSDATVTLKNRSLLTSQV